MQVSVFFGKPDWSNNVNTEWMVLGIQAGGAIGVCGMFLWYLRHKAAEDEQARKVFLDAMGEKDKLHAHSIGQQMDYMRDRDSQSRELAENGHAALRAVSEQISLLRENIGKQTAEIKADTEKLLRDGEHRC